MIPDAVFRSSVNKRQLKQYSACVPSRTLAGQLQLTLRDLFDAYYASPALPSFESWKWWMVRRSAAASL